jgi:hypothetical protein
VSNMSTLSIKSAGFSAAKMSRPEGTGNWHVNACDSIPQGGYQQPRTILTTEATLEVTAD